MSKPTKTHWITEEQDAISKFLFGDEAKKDNVTGGGDEL